MTPPHMSSCFFCFKTCKSPDNSSIKNNRALIRGKVKFLSKYTSFAGVSFKTKIEVKATNPERNCNYTLCCCMIKLLRKCIIYRKLEL